MPLIKGLPDGRLLQRIVRFHRMGGLSERGLGFYLLDFNDRKLFRRHGFSSTVHFALIKLHLPAKKTRELLRMARALENLPLMDRAFASGKISWSAVRELTRVAVKETEQDWLDLAQRSTLRKVERTVSRTAFGERPPKDPYSLSKTKYRVEANLSSEDYALVQAAWARLRQTAGADLDASSAIVLLARNYLEQPLDQRERESRKVYQVVYHRCSECDRAWIESSDGPEGIPQTTVAEREKEAEVIQIEETAPDRDEDGAPRGSLQRTGRGPVANPVLPDTRDVPNTPRIRQHVLARDGGICAVPGCSNRGTLFAHHVIFRSRGGRTHLDNEVCLCQSCHSLVHEGLLQVEGAAPHGVVWKNATGGVFEARLTDEDQSHRYIPEQNKNVPRGSCGTMDDREDTTLYSLDEVPNEVDGAWWRKYGHNFEFKGRRVILKKARQVI